RSASCGTAPHASSCRPSALLLGNRDHTPPRDAGSFRPLCSPWRGCLTCGRAGDGAASFLHSNPPPPQGPSTSRTCASSPLQSPCPPQRPPPPPRTSALTERLERLFPFRPTCPQVLVPAVGQEVPDLLIRLVGTLAHGPQGGGRLGFGQL